MTGSPYRLVAGNLGAHDLTECNSMKNKRLSPISNYRKMKDMVYRAIHIDAWAMYVDVRTQSTRDLRIQTAKLKRLAWWDKIEFIESIESPKKATRLTIENNKKIVAQYKTVVSLVEKVFHDVAAHKNEQVTNAQIQGRADKFLQEVEAYGKKHSVD
jgi:hypothetical protein